MSQSHETIRVLSIDGGGSRGLFSLQLLCKIRDSLTSKGSFYKRFNLIVGVSVGAILAAAIACELLETSTQCQNLLQAGLNIFGIKNESQPLLAPVYVGIEKKNALLKIFGNMKMKECKVPLVIVTATVSTHQSLFTSWQHPELYIWQVLEASSAAPIYFPPVKINDNWYMDGGIMSNSPAAIAMNIGIKFFRGKIQLPVFDSSGQEIHPSNFRILSIGNKTDIPKEIHILNPQHMGMIAWIRAGLIDTIIGINDTSSFDLVETIFGKNVIFRFVGNLDPKFDDVSIEFQEKIKQEVESVWNANEIKIRSFF